MPINIPTDLPATATLEQENIFVMSSELAVHQDIRPLKIAILNLMPKKIETETQLLRLLGNTPLQVDIELLQTATYTSKNTAAQHLLKFYKTFDDVKDQRFDGMIITGAPVEQMEFEDVNYWNELCDIMEWTKTNVYSTFHICWGAQAALHYHYGINKHALDSKVFGIFEHDVLNQNHKLMRGFDDSYLCPHSRHTTILEDDIKSHTDLEILSFSKVAGVNIIASKGDSGRQFFATGHCEYDRETLANEYFRDLNAGLPITPPVNYFPDDDNTKTPPFLWRGHANLLFTNWLNYFVYQQTPFNLDELN